MSSRTPYFFLGGEWGADRIQEAHFKEMSVAGWQRCSEALSVCVQVSFIKCCTEVTLNK